MTGINVLAVAGIGNFGGIETGAGIAHYDQNASILIAGDIAFDNFRWIVFCSMHDGVSKSFGQCQFDIVLASRSAFYLPNHIHHAADDRVNGVAIGSKRHAELEVELVRVKVTGLRRLS